MEIKPPKGNDYDSFQFDDPDTLETNNLTILLRTYEKIYKLHPEVSVLLALAVGITNNLDFKILCSAGAAISVVLESLLVYKCIEGDDENSTDVSNLFLNLRDLFNLLLPFGTKFAALSAGILISNLDNYLSSSIMLIAAFSASYFVEAPLLLRGAFKLFSDDGNASNQYYKDQIDIEKNK